MRLLIRVEILACRVSSIRVSEQARIMTYRKWIDARRLLARSRLPPIRGYTPSAPRYGLLAVSSLKQLPKPVCQQFDGLSQGAELPNPDYRDGSVQVKRRGTQYFH